MKELHICCYHGNEQQCWSDSTGVIYTVHVPIWHKTHFHTTCSVLDLAANYFRVFRMSYDVIPVSVSSSIDWIFYMDTLKFGDCLEKLRCDTVFSMIALM